MNLRAAQRLYRVKRLLSYQNKPIVFCDTYVPYKMFSNLEKYEDYYFEKYAFYIFLEKEFGISVISHSELISISEATNEISDILNIKKGHPVFTIKKRVYTHKETPCEYRQSYCLIGDRKFRRNF